jgi:hypothetical protein
MRRRALATVRALTAPHSMRHAPLLLGALAVMAPLHPSAARAQAEPPPAAPQGAPPQAAAPAPCWEIVAPVAGTDPPTMVMLNRCTGDTWLLAKEVTRAARPTAPGTYVYRWRRIAKTDEPSAADFSIPSASLR